MKCVCKEKKEKECKNKSINFMHKRASHKKLGLAFDSQKSVIKIKAVSKDLISEINCHLT